MSGQVTGARRSWIGAGCGCVLAAGAALMTLGGILAAVQGTAPVLDMALSATCFGALTLLGVAAVAFGLSRKPVDPTTAMHAAAAQAMRTGGTVDVNVPASTDVASVRDAFRGALGAKATDVDREWDRATNLLMARKYDEALRAFHAFGTAHPERGAQALASMGACLHCLGRYEEAIQHYEAARAQGEHPATMDENIAESRTALARRRP